MEGRRRVTLYDQMTGGDDTSSSSRNSLASLFLDDVVLAANQKNSRNQTLLDIIREDAVADADEPNINNTNNNTNNRNSWKAFKDKLLLKRASTSTLDIPNNGVEALSQTRPDSDESTHQQQRNDDVVVVHQEPDNSDPTTLLAGGGESSDEDNNNPETRQVNMSLMDLLEETEADLDLIRSDDDVDVDDVDEYQKEEEEQQQGGREEGGVERVVEYNCCVCMVRHKGAAFIPCGHTFCRMCSRELWVSRGNCPLCNNFILEILDIF